MQLFKIMKVNRKANKMHNKICTILENNKISNLDKYATRDKLVIPVLKYLGYKHFRCNYQYSIDEQGNIKDIDMYITNKDNYNIAINIVPLGSKLKYSRKLAHAVRFNRAKLGIITDGCQYNLYDIYNYSMSKEPFKILNLKELSCAIEIMKYSSNSLKEQMDIQEEISKIWHEENKDEHNIKVEDIIIDEYNK